MRERLKSLEALRGISALSVLGAHIFAFLPFTKSSVLPASFTKLLASLFPGHLGVLYFFVLSGFVIGTAHPPEKELDPILYLNKRFIRLWPMLIFSALLGSAAVAHIDWKSLAKCAAFLGTSYPGNTVIWSVSFEFWFYLVLPLLFAFSLTKNARPLFAIGLFLLGFYFVAPSSVLPGEVRTWLLGLFIWMIGLWLAWFRPALSLEINGNELDLSFLYWMLFAASFYSIGGGVIAAASRNLGVFDSSSLVGIIGPADIIGLPLVIGGFLTALGKAPNNRLAAMIFYGYTIGISAALIASLFNGVFFRVSAYPASLIQLFGAWAIYIIEPSRRPSTIGLPVLAGLGGISYGIYIFHMPLMILTQKATSILEKDWPAFQNALSLSLGIGLVLSLSWVAEIKVQPRIRRSYLLAASKLQKRKSDMTNNI